MSEKQNSSNAFLFLTKVVWKKSDNFPINNAKRYGAFTANVNTQRKRKTCFGMDRAAQAVFPPGFAVNTLISTMCNDQQKVASTVTVATNLQLTIKMEIFISCISEFLKLCNSLLFPTGT